MYRIIKNREIAKNVFELVVENELIASHFKPGQFVVVMPDETSEKIGKLRANGMSVPEIAEEMGMKTNTVWSYLPYSKGMYNQEYPTINAIRVRNSKRKAKEKALTCTDTAQNEGSGAC